MILGTVGHTGCARGLCGRGGLWHLPRASFLFKVPVPCDLTTRRWTFPSLAELPRPLDLRTCGFRHLPTSQLLDARAFSPKRDGRAPSPLGWAA